MAEARYLTGKRGQKIAYHQIKGKSPGVIFLGGFKSDMEGSKAQYLQALCEKQGRSYVRFDYTGHGKSSGEFTDGCIGDWAEDAAEVLNNLCTGPQILVGSSMGGWISLLLARTYPAAIAGILGIAAAPDFTQDSMWPRFSDAQKHELKANGVIYLPSDYGAPYPITRRLIEDGKNHLVMRSELKFNFPVRLVQGTLDNAVTRETALRLLDHIDAPDVQLQFLKGADHSFSDPRSLDIIDKHLNDLLQ